MKVNNTKEMSFKDLFESKLVEVAIKPSNKKKSVKKLLNTLAVYDQLNNTDEN